MRYPLRRACLIFGRSGTFLYLWAHLHNLIKQNTNFSILKKIENPLLNPLKFIYYIYVFNFLANVVATK